MALPNITIAPGLNAIEGGIFGEFIITLDAPAPAGGLIVKFAVAGSSTATAIADYTFGAGNNITSLTTNTFTVAAGATTAIIRVTAPIDGVIDPNETITLNLTDSVKYSPVSNFNAGTQPRYVTSADINRDGKVDLVVANQTGGVSILYNNGNGGFSVPNLIGTGQTGASAVEISDFNDDGIFDIVATDSDRDNPLTSSTGKVSVLLGTSNGGFSAPQVLSSGPWLKSIAVGGDFNGDGKSDLAVTSFDGNAISIFNGSSNGSFSSGTPIAVGVQPLSIAVGNFNGDNKSDLAVVNLYSNNISIVLGGNSATTVNLPVGTNPTSVTINDFDGDGNSDLAVTNFTSNNVSILFGNGTGNFGRTKILNTGVGLGSYSIKTGDFNGDGKSDLAVAKFYSNEIAILLGNGDGDFNTPTIFSLGAARAPFTILGDLLKRLTPITIGDFNSDGKSDLAVANFDNNNVSVLLNVSPSTSIAIQNTLLPPINTVPTAQTINEDIQTAITGISVNDLDGNLASTKLTVANGTLNIDVTGGAAILTGANNSSTLTLTGTQTQINTALGTLKYQGNLNFHGADALTALSTDSSGTPLTDADTVSLTINPVNDAPTGINLSATSINENVPSNTAIGTFTTTDPDNSAGFTYSFVAGTGDNDNSSLAINGNQLVISSSPDFESKSAYSVRVRSTDTDGLFFDKELAVTVNDLINNNVVGSSGNDTLFATNEIDNIQALDGDDSIFATVANLQPSDVFDGGNGNDTFYLSGGIPDQTLSVNLNLSNQFVSLVNPSVSNITIANTENIILTGFAGNASLNGNAFNNILTSGIGNDTLNGGVGNDTLAGGAGNDSYYIYDVGDTIIENANDGTDTVVSNLTVSVLVDNVENIGLLGSAAINATGNSLDNTITGNSANNILNGGLGNDFLRGELGNDSLIGGEGNDTLNGGVGADKLEGGIGDDLYYLSDANSGSGNDTVIENANSGIDTALSIFTVTALVNNVERLTLLGSAAINGTGNSLNNTITGNSANNKLDGGIGNDFLIGGDGNDSLIGGDGSDTLNGGDGNDTLEGGVGGDTLAGGRGNDTYKIDSVDDAISEFSTVSSEQDIVQASVSFTLGGNLENLTLTGSQAINGTGNDLNNVITGNGAANVLTGGLGDDTLIGGAGIDSFALGKTGVDTIQDFAVGERLLISASDFGGLTAGALANNKLLVGAGAINAATSDQRFLFDTTDKFLYFDVDGLNGLAAVKIGVLTGVSTLNSSNFSIF